ncbi:SusC/RagA family TonB-linked outer membrane protein [Flavobacterium johnsoniae]|uniref:SusC-like TonB-dependent receptor n=1 Tax=Flavobacterium johnsoniae (strain ATCC 17061 / DSM 2064 / JCM 8514 / BCRC 14874 / CCUG 350202 / NBRC 14942 / NCIMB 11054 / UW101) TaxID=376686 RepID=A5FBP7_FLAJ1|nr:SusC/RagA family TonB-linked outer membrane protein [Flavobacterium johnsoniae]ABQ07380.1 SusC-like TonB-dependent receptor [Flavobacterium johnsoniae UW101]OXE99293.1 SusC/RagA family TonB-linked outer membrane protein [Flavobacterium johnsoniae UW101]WQG80784.1 SusC/RagA family TonB-linked outer membrane protein [Flavobacterium johnsoniae UW101]SHL14677.1 TonB-linked outer membrane protein, SusC/RagA family [Flavobacterium johnsoniae]
MNNFSFIKGGLALYCLIFAGFLFSFSSIYSRDSINCKSLFYQQHLIQGIISDGISPLPGVTVTVKSNRNLSCITDYNGQYSLKASPQDTLIVSFIGFKTALVPLNGRTKVDVKLLYDTTTLQEVRVNAGYYSVKESERTGSISRIGATDIEKQPVSNVLATMQGRMAGVNITQDSGTPGAGFQIQIRGLNSLRTEGNNPLYIINGVPYSSENIGYSNTTTGVPTPTSPLASINPNDIESIEVLKDADATAIYGSRGANGVVLITTKKGTAGKTKVIIAASSGFGRATRFMDLMNTQQYLEMRRQGFANDGITSYPASAYDINGTWDQKKYTNWQKELTGGTSVITNLQTTLTGGSQNTQYLLSGTYRTETTVLPADFGYDKGAFNFNLNHASEDKKFKLTFSTGYTFQSSLQAATDMTRTARNLAPNAPSLYNSDGSLNFENSTWQNPLASLRSTAEVKTNDLNMNSVISYQVKPQWEIKINLGFTDLNNAEMRLLPSTMFNPALNYNSSRSSMYSNLTQRQSWIIEPQLRWKHDFEESTLDILIGGTAQEQKTSRLYQFGRGFSSNSLIRDFLSATTKTIFLSDEIQYRYQAFFARANYNWNQKYILNLTARRDGSSRFGPGRQFATFGAAGAAWLFSKEKFLQNSTFLSFGKLRASYGTTGSDQIGDYQYLDTYVSSSQSYNGIIAMDPTRLFNPDFSWEVNKKLEIAVEAGFYKDCIFLTAAWYRNRSSNQLVGIPLPATTGFTSISANLAAEVENSGVEFTLRTVNLNRNELKWKSSFNISVAKNKLTAFPGLEGSTYANRYVIGQSTSIVKVYNYVGIDPVTGLYKIEDVNKDGIITSLGDKKTIMDLSPKYFGGLDNQFEYKNWKLDFLFQFVKQLNYSYTSNVPGGSPINQPSAMTDAWLQQGDVAQYQINTSGQNGNAVNAFYNYTDSNANIVDGSYIRLKNIALSYRLPLHNSKGVGCRISLLGQNLLTFTSYKGGDPEFKYTAYLPPLKVLTAGIELTF